MTDWTTALIAFGNSRDWQPLPKRRALKAFSAFSGLEVSGFGADLALRSGYHALAQATPDERAACTDWQAVKALMDAQKAARAALVPVPPPGFRRWLGLAMDSDAPPILWDGRSVMMACAVPVWAETREEAHAKVRQWHDLAARYNALDCSDETAGQRRELYEQMEAVMQSF